MARWISKWAPVAVLIAVCAGVFGPAAAAQQYDVRERQLGERVLSVGAWGADVFTLQLYLRELGFDLQADGRFGPKTRDAVRAFQEQSGIRATGSVGPETLAALNEALARRTATITYTVQPGDSLWSIARAFQTTMETLIELNNLPDRPLWGGEKLLVPAVLVHVVKPGDTLWGIARQYGTTVGELAALNNLDPEGILRVGIELRLPRGASPVR